MNPTPERMEWRGLALACALSALLWGTIIAAALFASGWRP